MKLTEEMKNALFITGIFLFLLVATGWLVQNYMQEKSAEKARIAELQGLAAYEQAKWERDNYIKLMPLLAEYEAKKEVAQMEKDRELAKAYGIIVRTEK